LTTRLGEATTKKTEYNQVFRRMINGLCYSSDALRDVIYIRMDIRRNIVLYIFIKLKYVWKETFEETKEVILTLNVNRPKEMDYACLKGKHFLLH
jgi:chloramphenicol O-acetyltransferase